MNGLLLALFLLQLGPQQNPSAVTGVVRGANGMPAPGVRVYAIAVSDASEAGRALESLASTDAAGKYRLEVAPGRYYIASGSVDSPTFYPRTADVSMARVISITAGGLVENIDFSSFVPASRSPRTSVPPLSPGSTGVLQGTIRFPDGTPATGITVVAAPVAAITGPPSNWATSILSSITAGANTQNPVIRRIVNNDEGVQTSTDASGRYRLEKVRPGTYYIAAGFSDPPVLFPGTSDLPTAKTVVTTPTTQLDALDFTVPHPSTGVSVSGRVIGLGGAPAAGATLQIMSRASRFLPFGFPDRNYGTTAAVKADGTFEALQLPPGDYWLETLQQGVRPDSRSLSVAYQPVTGLDLYIPIANLTGRILMDDGSVLSNPQIFADALVTTVSEPNSVSSTIFPISSDGTFTRLIDADEYRFYLRNLPEEYNIRSITSGTQDLLRETLKVPPTSTVNIEVRVTTRAIQSPSSGDVRMSGRVLDSITGLPAQAERVTLCCMASGASERFSTPLRADGSFEFAGVPRGRYELGVQVKTGQSQLFTVDSEVRVADEPVSGLTVLSAPELRRLKAVVVFENGNPLSETAPTSVVFRGASGRVRVVADHYPAGYFASVPVGDRYDVSVANLPEGYVVRSISGSAEAPRSPQAIAPITITLAPAPNLQRP